MFEKRFNGNLFLLPDVSQQEAAVITTNGIVKKNGHLVMGAGIAKYALDAYPGIDRVLGIQVSQYGNHAYALGDWCDPNRKQAGLNPIVRLLSMPTKHDWKDPSNLDLIARSCRELTELADKGDLKLIFLPAPGCTNGQLDYEHQVRPVISKILDDRFVVVVHRYPIQANIDNLFVQNSQHKGE